MTSTNRAAFHGFPLNQNSFICNENVTATLLTDIQFSTINPLFITTNQLRTLEEKKYENVYKKNGQSGVA